MQGSFTCFILLCWALVAHAAFSGVPKITAPLDLVTGYEIFWVNGTNVNVAFLLSSDGVSGYHGLYKSTDQGVTWTAINPNPSCYAVRVYQNPVFPDQILFIGPPESKCGFVTANAGQTFTTISPPALTRISFNSNGWGIGRTLDSKYYTSNDMFTQWTEITGATRAEWILSTDFATLPVYSMYIIKDRVFGYSTDNGATLTPIINGALDFYRTGNFIYVLTENRTLAVGRDKDNIYTAYFPFGETLPNVFTVSDDVSGATWFYTDNSYYWGNVYTAGSTGGLYTQSRQHVLKREDAFLDIHSVRGLPGVHILNQVVNYNDFKNPLLKTYITFDNGGEWKPLTPPAGSNPCPTCSLNLYFNYKTGDRPLYTSANTLGLIIANGYISSALSYDNPINLNTYLSRDAGLTWSRLYSTGPYVFQVGANGGIIVFADQNKLTNFIYYSFDQGLTVSTANLPYDQAYITTIETSVTGNSTSFVLFGVKADGNGIIYVVNFAPVQMPACTGSAYEVFTPSDGSPSECWLGQKIQISRRSRNAPCLDIRGEQVVGSSTCACDFDDYECDFGFSPSGASNETCVLTGTLPPDPPTNCIGTYHRTKGYRLVPGDRCSGGLDLNPTTVTCPKNEKKSSSSAWVAIVVILVVAIVLGLAAFIVYRDPALREKVSSFLRINRSGASRYSRVGGRSNSLADESDFGIHDDLLEDGSEEEDAKVLHDNDISRASGRSDEFNSRHDSI